MINFGGLVCFELGVFTHSKTVCTIEVFVKRVTCQRVPYPLDTSLNNDAVIYGPAAADTSTSAVGQPRNPLSSGQAPIPSTAGGVVSANGTSPSPTVPSSNGECCNLRNTKGTVNGTTVIYLETSLVFCL